MLDRLHKLFRTRQIKPIIEIFKMNSGLIPLDYKRLSSYLVYNRRFVSLEDIETCYTLTPELHDSKDYEQWISLLSHDFQKVLKLYNEMIEKNVMPSRVLMRTLANTFYKNQRLDLLNQMCSQKWKLPIAIERMVLNKKLDNDRSALKNFLKEKKDEPLDIGTFNLCLKEAKQLKDYKTVSNLFNSMQELELQPNDHTLSILIQAFLNDSREFHCQDVFQFVRDIGAYNSRHYFLLQKHFYDLKMYSKSIQAFESILEPDVHCGIYYLMACKKARQSPKFDIPDHENNVTYLKLWSEFAGKAELLRIFKVHQKLRVKVIERLLILKEYKQVIHLSQFVDDSGAIKEGLKEALAYSGEFDQVLKLGFTSRLAQVYFQQHGTFDQLQIIEKCIQLNDSVYLQFLKRQEELPKDYFMNADVNKLIVHVTSTKNKQLVSSLLTHCDEIDFQPNRNALNALNILFKEI